MSKTKSKSYRYDKFSKIPVTCYRYCFVTSSRCFVYRYPVPDTSKSHHVGTGKVGSLMGSLLKEPCMTNKLFCSLNSYKSLCLSAFSRDDDEHTAWIVKATRNVEGSDYN